MSYYRVCRAPRQEPSREWLLRVYRAEPLRRLLALETALLHERRDKLDADTQAFCTFRLPLLHQVIVEKTERPSL